MSRIVISVAGAHAGEAFDQIVQRKREDIDRIGFTLWAYHSHAAPLHAVQGVGLDGGAVCFIKATAPSKTPGGTKSAFAARQMRKGPTEWADLPAGLSPVTGHFPGLKALVLGDFRLEGSTVDLGGYLDISHPHAKPATPRLGSSTLVCMPAPTPWGRKPRLVIAAGRLAPPYCVELR